MNLYIKIYHSTSANILHKTTFDERRFTDVGKLPEDLMDNCKSFHNGFTEKSEISIIENDENILTTINCLLYNLDLLIKNPDEFFEKSENECYLEFLNEEINILDIINQYITNSLEYNDYYGIGILYYKTFRQYSKKFSISEKDNDKKYALHLLDKSIIHFLKFLYKIMMKK